MAKKVTPGYKQRLAKLRADADLPPLSEPTGKRMMIEFGGGAPDQRITDARNRMDPDYEGQFSQEPGAYAKPTRIEIKGEAARDYSNELGTRQQVREIASDTWKRTPLPVLDARDLNDEKLIAENDRAKRYGLSVSPLDNKIAAQARARRDPRAVQQALENLKTENVVTGGPGLDPGETMPADAYLRMRQREHAADRADKTGQVQYLGHGPGNIAEWMAPSKPIPTEIMGVGGKSVLVNLRPSDKAAYDAAMAPLDIEMKRIAQGLPGPNRSPDQIRADMQKVAEATIAKARMAELPIPASDMSSGAGVPTQDRPTEDSTHELQYTPQQMKEIRTLEEGLAKTGTLDYLTPSQRKDAEDQFKTRLSMIQPVRRLLKKNTLEGDEEGSVKSMNGHFYQVQKDPRTKSLIRKRIGEDRTFTTNADKAKEKDSDLKAWEMAMKAATVKGLDGESVDEAKLMKYYRMFRGGGAAPAPDQIQPATIDTSRLPAVRNPDGSDSTVRSITIESDGKFFNIPTVIGGKVVDNASAIADWKKHPDKHLGIFTNQGSALADAEVLHQREARRIAGQSAPTATLPLPPDPKQWRAGQVYTNSKGARGRWNGQGFEVVK